VHRRAELLNQRRFRIIGAHIRVIRLISVRAPIPFDLAVIHVDDGNTMVEITICNVRFVGFGVDHDLRHSAEVLHVVAAAGSGRRQARWERVSVLRNKLTRLRELQDVGIAVSVSTDPDEAFVVDGNAVIGVRPFVAFEWIRTVSAGDGISRRIEFEHRRCLGALGRDFAFGE